MNSRKELEKLKNINNYSNKKKSIRTIIKI